jgi:hypothetical protein
LEPAILTSKSFIKVELLALLFFAFAIPFLPSPEVNGGTVATIDCSSNSSQNLPTRVACDMMTTVEVLIGLISTTTAAALQE